MKRTTRLAAAAAALVVAGATAGYLAASRLAPERVRVEAERSLTGALGGEVHVARARVAFGRGVALLVEEVEAWPEDGAPALRVERAAARLDPFALAFGRLRLRELVLERPELVLVRKGDGTFAPARAQALLRPKRPDAATSDGGARELVRALARTPLAWLRASFAAPRRIELRNARVELRDEGSGAVLALDPLAALAVRRRRGDVELGASGGIAHAGAERGWVMLEARRERDGRTSLALDVRHLDLSVLAPIAGAVHPELSLAGVAQGRATLAQGEDPPLPRVELDLRVDDLRARVPVAGQAPLSLAGDRTQVRAALELAPAELRLPTALLDLDGRRVELEGALARPLSATSELRLVLRLRDADLARARDLAHALPDTLQRRIARPLDPLDAGRVSLLELSGSGPLARWLGSADPAAPEGELRIAGSARFRDVALRMGGGERIEGLSGRIDLARDRVELRGVRRARDVPELDVEISGLEHLLVEGRRVTSAPSLPGFGALVELWSRREAIAVVMEAVGAPHPAAPSPGPPVPAFFDPGRIELLADWLAHPLVAWPFEDLRVEVGALQDGVRALEGRGRWGGLAVEGTGTWRPEGPGHLALRIAVGAPPGALGARQREDWLEARVRISESRLRGIALPSATARLRGEGESLRVEAVEAPLAGGRLSGSARLDLSRADAVPVELTAALMGSELHLLGPALGLEPGDLLGRLDAEARGAGLLRPGEPVLAALSGPLRLRASAGVLTRRPPVSEAIGRSDDAFAELAGDRPMRFESFQAELRLGDGELAVESLVIEGEKARLAASGGLRLDDPAHPVEGVIGIFPRNAVDAIVGRLPLIGPILQGSDGTLVGRYVEVTGTWVEPEVRRIENRSLAAGLIEGVPGFVLRGLRAIGGALLRLAPLPGRNEQP